MSKGQTFRANVGMVVANRQGEVLALERAGRRGQWQMPQGGLDEGEEPVDAAWRELAEETGLTSDDVELEGEHPRWLAYELPPVARRPKLGRGQVQKWFLFRLRRDDVVVDLHASEHPEFDDQRWMPLSELAECTWEPRRWIYRELARHFGLR
jgi:putative (di)nucleoside polyphosphate hydrolase